MILDAIKVLIKSFRILEMILYPQPYIYSTIQQPALLRHSAWKR